MKMQLEQTIVRRQTFSSRSDLVGEAVRNRKSWAGFRDRPWAANGRRARLLAKAREIENEAWTGYQSCLDCECATLRIYVGLQRDTPDRSRCGTGGPAFISDTVG